MFKQLVFIASKRLKWLLLICFCLLPIVKAAEKPDESFFKINQSTNKGSELQLEAHKASLVQVLENLSKKTKIAIHYSVLPEELVTATCVGTSLKPVLECLFADKADVAFREDKSAKTNELVEAWITGSSLAGKIGKDASCIARAEKAEKELLVLKQKLEALDTSPDMTDEFLKMSESQKPEARAAAVGGLLSSKRKDDPAIKAVLEKALNDQNAAVRAQAVSTMAQLNGNDSDLVAILQDALQDESIDVRLMAVSSITDNVSLLQQAVGDSDETVRTLASIKLKELESKKH